MLHSDIPVAEESHQQEYPFAVQSNYTAMRKGNIARALLYLQESRSTNLMCRAKQKLLGGVKDAHHLMSNRCSDQTIARGARECW